MLLLFFFWLLNFRLLFCFDVTVRGFVFRHTEFQVVLLVLIRVGRVYFRV